MVSVIHTPASAAIYVTGGDGTPSGDTAALKAAITAAGAGGLLRLQPGRVYLVDETLTLLADQTIKGHGATLKRADAANSAATVGAAIGTNTVTVADASGFRVGQTINVQDVSDPNAGVGYDENQGSIPLTITDITANVITISETWARTIDIGDVVFARHEILHRIGASRDEIIRLEGITFDGNKAAAGFTSDWRLNRTCNVSTARVIADGCHFKNTPSENLVIDRGWVGRSSFDALEGSFVHVSSSLTVADDEVMLIQGCHGDGCNLATNAVMFHSQGMITLSNDARVHLDKCRFKNGAEHIIADGNFESSYIQITASEFDTFTGIVNHSSATTDAVTKRIRLSASRFTNCGDLTVYGREIGRGFPLDEVSIDRCKFLNSRFYFDNVAHLRVTRNAFLSDATYAAALTAVNAFMGLWNCDDGQVTHNVFQGPPTFDDNVRNCLYVRSDKNLKNSVGSNVGFRYTGNLHIDDNTFTRFRNCLAVKDTTPGTYTGHTLEWRGCTFRRNRIYTVIETIGSANAVPIVASPGWEVADNYVSIQSVGANVVPIQVLGLDVTGVDVDATTHRGPHVHDNVVDAPATLTHAIRIGRTGTTNDSNALVEDNTIPIAYTFEGSAASESVVGNYRLLSDVYPNITARTVPPANWPTEYSGQY